jgi:hypothetical protein
MWPQPFFLLTAFWRIYLHRDASRTTLFFKLNSLFPYLIVNFAKHVGSSGVAGVWWKLLRGSYAWDERACMGHLPTVLSVLL